MLALAEYRASRCPCGCGFAARDTLAHENDVDWRAVMAGRCLARDALLVAQEAFKNPRPEAMQWRLQMRRRR